MAISQDLLDQIYKIDCTGANIGGTGTYNCPFNFYRTSALIFTPQGFEFSEALSTAYLQQLQQEGNAVVLGKITGVEQRTAADNIVTETGSNIKTVAGKSPREFGFVFENGIYFDKAMRTLESFGQYDVTYVDSALSILMTSTDDAVKGFTVGQFAVEPYMQGNGADKPKTIAWLQELYRTEFDIDATWIIQANHNIRLAQLDGVNDAILKIETVPVATATTIVFSLKTKADKKGISNTAVPLAKEDIEFTKNGAVIALTSLTYSASTGFYTATVAALVAAQIVTLRTFQTGFPTGIILKGNRLFKSNTDTVTVTA